MKSMGAKSIGKSIGVRVQLIPVRQGALNNWTLTPIAMTLIATPITPIGPVEGVGR